MAAILYLDVDDEITSAAARIRAVTETKVALVLPPGSRLATSRINFRLLAREALERNRVLSIVAADPAARAIAASAGLPVHATVGEYEAEIAPPPASGAQPSPETPVEPSTSKTGRRRAAGAAAAGAAGAAGAAAAAGPGGTLGSPGPDVGPDGSSRPEQLSAELVAPVVVATASARTTPPPKPAAEAMPSPTSPGPSETRARSGAATIPIVPGATSGRGVPGGLTATVAVIVVVLLIVALLGYVVLPAASVVVTPVPVPVGPVEFVVRADPDATSVDPAGGVVPATRLSQDFTASGEFEATGERVVQTKAKGTLRWTNCDPTKAYTIPTGTVAQTGSGIGFETLSSVFLPVANLSQADPPKLTCQNRNVAGRAVRAGPSGNVGAGTVKVVPPAFNSVVIKVTNPAAMAGGARDVFPKVQQKDIDAALASLTKDLQAQFDAWVAAPDGVPPGSTVFPATGKLGTPVPSVDPGTIVDVEEKTFQLGATATGTVVAVDPKLIDQVAAERIAGSVPAEHTLQPGSVKSSHDGGQADGDLVDYRVTANAAAIPNLDPAALRDEIKGRSVDEAKQILGRYGTVTIDTWPGFVSSIPTLDFRVDLRVAGATPGASPSPGPSGSAP